MKNTTFEEEICGKSDESFSLDRIDSVREDVIEEITNFDTNHKPDQEGAVEEIKISDLEKEKFDIDCLFESLREKEDHSCC